MASILTLFRTCTLHVSNYPPHYTCVDSNSNSNPNQLQLLAKKSLESRASSLLQSCSSFSRLTQIQAHIIRNSLQQNHFLASRLLSSCFTLGCYSYASRIFGQLLSSDAFLFNAMIKGFASAGFHREVLHFYCMMLDYSYSFPSNFTFPLALKACSKLASIVEGRALHGHVLKLDHSSDIFIQTALVDLYGSCCEAEDARKVFDRMTKRDVVAWNAMVSAYVRSDSILLAEEMFEKMPVRNVNSWTTMIGGLLDLGDSRRALTTFRRMQLHGVKADKMAIVTILSAIADLGCLSSGKWVHKYIERNVIQIDVFVGTALIDMYSKSGSIKDAKLVFHAMRSKNTSCYNAMIFGLAVHGLGEEAIRVFEELRGSKMEIDDVTMIAVLTACSHSGLVEEGLRYFKMMKQEYDIYPKIKHYGCLIDLLGRAGRFMEAKKIVNSIQVDSVVLGTLASACRIHGNIELADELSTRISDLDPEYTGLLVWKANLLAAKNEWEEAAVFRRWMKEKGIVKGAGCSWIEFGDKVHWFVAGDYSHPRSSEIYSKLDELHNVIKLTEMEV
ncbi:putative pentatricopeptide repeat-containing protein At5g59200, chloroplastic [Dendrobium catenatum]|uniref:Pentatricopeptide repeat-containing protein n=1 Tax=Dendrobium catenatum TaxID=906689 RepID=A0A2I0W967_9ASPA|nr:putative pentatricopeptide repeat-containing protein At5g59200, chloroplastic [Dendrobium catenatum]PKU72209.1 Putative pentatricopeptide repeat-containing protein [Dendrobium catenatum]